MRKRKRPRNDKGSAVGVDLETFANTYVITRPNGKVRNCPQSRVVTLTPGFEHGRYSSKGDVAITPLESDQAIIQESSALSRVTKRVASWLGGEHHPK